MGQMRLHGMLEILRWNMGIRMYITCMAFPHALHLLSSVMVDRSMGIGMDDMWCNAKQYMYACGKKAT